MKNILNHPILAILCIALTFSACYKHETIVTGVSDYPSLRVVNGLNLYQPITGVSLVGYELDSVHIPSSFQYSGQTFALNKGMPDGYEDINVTVRHLTGRPDSVYFTSIIVDFKDGEITTITLNNGDDGYYLE